MGGGGDTHRLLLRVDCGSPEATSSRLFPVHRPDTAVVTGQSNPHSGGGEMGSIPEISCDHFISGPLGTRHRITFRCHIHGRYTQINFFSWLKA